MVAIGDSLEHDVGGARSAGVDSVFVLGGIHKDDVGLQPAQQLGENGRAAAGGDALSSGAYSFSASRLAAVCEAHGVAPPFVLPFFSWR